MSRREEEETMIIDVRTWACKGKIRLIPIVIDQISFDLLMAPVRIR